MSGLRGGGFGVVEWLEREVASGKWLEARLRLSKKKVVSGWKSS